MTYTFVYTQYYSNTLCNFFKPQRLPLNGGDSPIHQSKSDQKLLLIKCITEIYNVDVDETEKFKLQARYDKCI